MRKAIFSFASLLVLGACSSSSSSGSAPLTADQFDSQLGVLQCQRAARCGYIGASEEKKCEADLKANATKYPPVYSPLEGVKSGRLTFDASVASACLTAWQTVGCNLDPAIAADDKCAKAFVPAAAAGAACKSTGECVTGNYCDQGANGTSGCAGTCKPYLATGAACDPNAASTCATTDACDGTSKKCVTLPVLGAPCTSNGCQTPSFCKGYTPADTTAKTPEVPGTCAGYGKIGDVCQIGFSGNTDCSPELFCDDSQTPYKCAALVPSGGACASTSACADPFDCVGLTQDSSTGKITANGKCGAYLDIGAACDPTPTVAGCPWDSTCDKTAKTCKAGGQLGDACQGGDCSTALYCDGGSMKCTAAVALGGACTPPAVDSQTGFPTSDEPCHDGSCDATSKLCTLVCQ